MKAVDMRDWEQSYFSLLLVTKAFDQAVFVAGVLLS